MDDLTIKRFVKEIISEFHSYNIPKIYKRSIYVPKFKKISKIISIVGPRRAGKTYLMYQIMKEKMKEYDKENFLYINFEDERISDIKKCQLKLILDAYKELYPEKRPIIFLDEIQNVEGWDKFVRRLQEQGYELFITGSNSKLLSSEISTSLRGRTYSVEVFPLSFKEFLSFKGINFNNNWEYKQRSKIFSLFNKYMEIGGYPEIVLEDKKEIINDYFNAVFYRDILERYNIKNKELMSFLMKYLIKIYGREFSINKFNNIAKSSGLVSSTSVIWKYVSILEEVFFSFFLPSMHKGKKGLTYIKKSYILDPLYITFYNLDVDVPRLLENIVYLELRRRYKELFYYKNRYKCDFISKDSLIQVTYLLNDENKERELKGMNSIKHLFKKQNIILTFDQEDKIDGVDVIPIWKWLLK